MSLKQLLIVSILGCSSLALADTSDHPRVWTILAADNHAAHSQDSKPVADPGVLVTSQRDPHGK
jgi:hypothetical protein